MRDFLWFFTGLRFTTYSEVPEIFKKNSYYSSNMNTLCEKCGNLQNIIQPHRCSFIMLYFFIFSKAVPCPSFPKHDIAVRHGSLDRLRNWEPLICFLIKILWNILWAHCNSQIQLINKCLRVLYKWRFKLSAHIKKKPSLLQSNRVFNYFFNTLCVIRYE